MMQVVIFEGYMKLDSYQANVGRVTIEDEVDQFLSNHPYIEIKHVKQSSAASGESKSFSNVTTISIWYTDQQ